MPSTECASCCLQRTRTRSRNPPSSPAAQQSIPRNPARPASSFCELPHLLRGVASGPYSPVAGDEQPHAARAPAPVLLLPATALPEVWSDVAAHFETDPTGVVTG